MNKTYTPKAKEIVRQWYLVDAKDKILGRVAAKVASILRGKHKTIYTPHMDTGDCVIVLNASKVRVTGNKMKDSLYRRNSGYPGGLREIPLEVMLARRPTTVMHLAVQRMLPQGPLARDIIKKLKVYADDKHPHKDQKPIILEIK